jgi:hypothetical protein
MVQHILQTTFAQVNDNYFPIVDPYQSPSVFTLHCEI